MLRYGMAYVLHRLPAVAHVILTPEYVQFAEAVMSSHARANQQAALDVSPAMGDILTDMQGCLQQLCGSTACGDPETVARLIAEKITAMNTGSGCDSSAQDSLGEVFASPPAATPGTPVQEPTQTECRPAQAKRAKGALIHCQSLYDTSGSISTVQLAWQEWTNGGQHTIADRVKEIKADSALGIGRRNSTLHKKNRHP